MDLQQFYNVWHEPAMGSLTAIYFFFIGLGAGSMLVSVIAGLFGQDGWARIERIGARLTPFLVIIGGLFLFADIGQPLRAWRLAIHFNPGSVASWGVRLVGIFIILGFINLWFLARQQRRRWFNLICGFFAIAVALYSGFLLVQMQGHELWNSPMIPVIFFMSAIVSAIALTLIVAVIKKLEKPVVNNLVRFLVGFILFELLLVFIEFVTLFNSSAHAAEVGKLLLAGALSPLFLWLYIIVGMVVPAIILWRIKTANTQIVAAVLVLIGVLSMRFAVIFGGQYLPLS